MKILQEAHGGANGGHSRVKKTPEMVRRIFVGKKILRETCKLVVKCDICHKNKTKYILAYSIATTTNTRTNLW